jgi:hypothetical protein
MCSSRDPVKEAQDWVQNEAGDLNGYSQAVVLGLGTGYHIVELQRQYPNLSVCVVECQPEFVCPAMSLHEESFRAEVLVTESLSIFKAQSRVRALLKAPFAVLRYNPVCSQNIDLYEQFQNLLTGRTVEALQFQLQKRADLGRQLCIEEVSRPKETNLLSIKDLSDALTPQASHEEFHLIRALRELVV